MCYLKWQHTEFTFCVPSNSKCDEEFDPQVQVTQEADLLMNLMTW